MTGPVRLAMYQELAERLRHQIAAGELPVGFAIPSTAELGRRYSVSTTVARAAVAQLRAAGLVVGQPGKGVFVRATPEDVAEHAVSVEELGRQVAELRECYKAERARREQLEDEVARLRQEIESIRARLERLPAPAKSAG